MAKTLPKNIWLQCGCCGTQFKTWNTYVDQDQDKGFGICASCQTSINDQNQAELDKLVEVLRNGLNDKNREKFNAMPKEIQEGYALTALEEGLITWKITPHQTTLIGSK